MAVRSMGVAVLLAALVGEARRASPGGVAASLAGLLLVAFLDGRNPLSLRNFFLVYTVGLFSIGVPLFGLPTRLYADMALYCLIFVAGYAAGSLSRPAPRPSDPAPTSPSGAWLRRAEELLILLVGAQVLLLAFNVSHYGVGGFYSGQPLVDQLNTYGKASVSGGLLQIVSFFLRYTTVAVVIVYVQQCLVKGVKLRYRYLALLFVVLPILSLQRSDAVHGAGILLVINAIERRWSRRRAPAAAPVADSTAAPVRPRARRGVAVGAAVIVAFLAALVIGGLRQGRLGQDDPSASLLAKSAPLLQSELTPVQAYSQIKDNQVILRRTHGSTVVWPLLLKVVPRGLFPAKPLNSAAYFMTTVRPAEFAAGYAVPPTLFGDAYINFGLAGAVVACLLVGVVAARLDVAYKDVRLSRVPAFLIVYASFYALLRSPLAESLAGILLTWAAWRLLRRPLSV
ncbi:MAG: hypothetical protein ABR511_05680 [Acidimicrobiales bacterium]